MHNTEEFTYKSRMPANVQDVFAWHERPGAFERLSPPWVRLDVLERSGGIRDGARVTMRVGYGPINTVWTVEHKNYVENEQFCDFQVHGPMAYYEQVHKFVPETDSTSFLDDIVTFELPAADFAPNFVARNEFERLFRYRHQIVADDLQFANQNKGSKPMNIAVTGSTGFIGSALVPFLTTQGNSVRRLVRAQSQGKANGVGETMIWNPSEGVLDAAALEGCDALVHLAGDNVGNERWSAEKKTRMRQSRIDSTRLLCQNMAQMKNPPKIFVCASAIGFYGDRGADVLTEQSTRGSGFLAELCQEWEATAKEAEQLGVRVVNSRIGVVLSPKGGALQKMLLPFQMGGGGIIGDGKQYFSWIALDDVIGAILHCLQTDSVKGPVNLVSPNTVTNQEFTHTFGRVIQRPTIIPMPAFGARLAFGEFADECLLASSRVVPEKLIQSSYSFRYPDLEGALRHVLGKQPATAH
jgi:uncharacterized protein (TIGR01777 family)